MNEHFWPVYSAKLIPQITVAQALPNISENRRLQPNELAWTLSLDVSLALGGRLRIVVAYKSHPRVRDAW